MSRDPDKDNSAQSRESPGAPEGSQSGAPGEQPTFGSFVSSSVRRSASRFRGRSGDQRPSPGAQRTSRRGAATDPGHQRTFVPARERRPTGSAEGAPPTPEPAPRSTTDAWVQDFVDRAGGPQRALGAAVVLGIVLLVSLALLWSLVSDDDGGGADVTPTATESDTILFPTGFGTPASPTPNVGASPAGPGQQLPPTRDTGPARDVLVTPTIGSDNVLDQNRQSTPGAGASTGPPAASCSQTCLVRVENAGRAEVLLAEHGTRPSYTSEEWIWAVAEPADVAGFSSELDTDVIRESSETLALYMVTVPPGVAEQGAVENFGGVLDSVDNYRLVEVASVPADVQTVIQTGLIVEKVAPAPPSRLERPGDRQTLEEVGVGSLASEVESARLRSTIAQFQGAGSTDGTGIGTRYYTEPGNQVAADMLYRELEAYGLDVWYEDFVTPDGYLLVNVVGEIPGSDPSRIYGVMAHFDSISDTPRVAAPGADDNGSGIAATLEISRILAGYDLRYSYRAVFINSEETGILGAEAFAEEAVEEGEPWEGIFNIDSVGSARNGNQLVLNATGESVWMEDIIARVNEGYDLGQMLNVLQSDEIVADDNRLRARGLESVLIARELYGWSPIHHTTNDVIENVSIPHVESATELVLLTVASLLL